MRRFSDEQGNEVRLTDERLSHMLRRHPEMAFQMHRLAETLAKPDAVRFSQVQPDCPALLPALPEFEGQEPLRLPGSEEGKRLLLHPHRNT